MDYISSHVESTSVPDQLLDKLREPGKIGPPKLTNSEILGRNTWMLWCGGNEGFWDHLSTQNHGFLDFLKLVDSKNRATRWRDVGLVNEPGMREATAEEHELDLGLRLDQPIDPKQAAYRRKVIDAAFGKGGGYASKFYGAAGQDELKNAFDAVEYDESIPPAGAYGLSTGVIGLRLFPNPNFDDKARKRWDAKRYYEDSSYFNDPALVRPFRVGMSCAFCHANPHPLNPPLNPANPRWENLSGSIGAQYMRVRAVFANMLTPDNFIYHVLDSQPPGTIDTSLVASDNINNTNTMNAIFGVPARAVRSFENPREHISTATSSLPSLWRDPDKQAPDAFKNLLGDKLKTSNDSHRYVPRILFDGADSIGVYGALARVYLNIGTHYEQWIRLHEPLLGVIPPAAASEEDRKHGRTQLPFKIKDCQENSVYWQATQLRVDALRDYFLRITPTMPLLDAKGIERPGGSEGKPRVDVSRLAEGRKVFAKNCIVCHSSIQPETPPAWFLPEKAHAEYYSTHRGAIDRRKAAILSWENDPRGEVWDHDPGQWLRDPDYLRWALEVVDQKSGEFWKRNFLSTDFRIPVNYIGTNSARAMATNATQGHMWEDFSSDSYRRLPSVGSISYFNPFTRRDERYTARHKVATGVPAAGGGPGFYRPASLMGLWATAPFLHNNSLGLFNNDPSVKGRLEAFDDAIRKLLYPERRLQHSDYATPEQLRADHGLIWRTPTVTHIQIRASDVPQALRRIDLPGWLLQWAEKISPNGSSRAMPVIALFVLALLILWIARGRRRGVRWWRYAAYVLMLFGLFVGFLVYLNSAGLGDLRIGPIPAGTPVNLLANINPDVGQEKLGKAIIATVDGLTEIETRRLEGADRDRVFREKIGPALLEVSKCPDFVMDKGHVFPWFADMTDADKEALIELLKTF